MKTRMNSFTANGTTYLKSRWSETDWTRQCVGVASCPCGSAYMQMADSVTQDELTGFPRREFLGFMAATK